MEDKKISFMASLLKSAAEEWLYMWMEEKSGLATQANQNLQQFLNAYGWSQFIIDLHGAFAEVQAQDLSMDKLEKLQQKGYTTEDYTVRFKNLAGQANLTDERQKIRLYQKGLDPRVLQDVMKIRPLPNTFQAWTEAATEEDNQYRRTMQMLGKPLKTPRFGKSKFAFRNAFTKARDPMAMDIDNVDMMIAAFNTLTVEEKQRLQRDGLCFKCGKPGHYAANCPQRFSHGRQQSRTSTRSSKRLNWSGKGKGKPYKPTKETKNKHAYAFIRALLTDGSTPQDEDNEDYEDNDVDELLQDFHQGYLQQSKP